MATDSSEEGQAICILHLVVLFPFYNGEPYDNSLQGLKFCVRNISKKKIKAN
jgi:hypothetical protein